MSRPRTRVGGSLRWEALANWLTARAAYRAGAELTQRPSRGSTQKPSQPQVAG